jgi:hypothetical protein
MTNNLTRDQSVLEPMDSDDKGIQNLRHRALAAIQASEQRHAARGLLDPEEITHKCWSELYSWCVQYLEGWRKPQGLVLSNHVRLSSIFSYVSHLLCL